MMELEHDEKACPPDDQSIPSEDNLWRRIPPNQWVRDDNLGRVRPSSGSFENDRQHPMSSIWVERHRECGLGLDDVLVGHPNYRVVNIPVSLARQLGQKIHRDEITEPPPQPAHVLVCGPKTKSVKNKFAKNCSWVGEAPELS